MRKESRTPVVFRYRRPIGSRNRTPSAAMAQALRHLSESEEMEPLLSQARDTGREVVIEVFHSKDGQPLLIHTALRPEPTA
jgi:hypothetical protein